MFIIRRRSTALPSFYKNKVAGQQISFQSSMAGRLYIFEFAATTETVDRTARGITEPVPAVANAIDVTLPFTYFVGMSQLQLYSVDPATGAMTRLLRQSDFPASGALNAGALVYANLGAGAVTFDETSSTGIRIYNTFPGDIFAVGFGHTAAPASLGKKVTVENQADNIAIELEGAGDGIVLVTPDGRRVRFSVHNGLGPRVEQL